MADLAVANFSSNNVACCWHGQCSFQSPVNYGAGSGPFGITVGDFNGDGLLISPWQISAATMRVSCLALATAPFRARQLSAASGPTAVAVGDFNGDGKMDLAVTNFSSNSVSILLGMPAGCRVRNYGAGSPPYSVAVGEFNGDGKGFAIASYGDNNVSVPGER